MKPPTRYAGRCGGAGIGDDLPGPTTIDQLFRGDGVIVDDPVSFPWHLIDDGRQREPLLVDLRASTDADLLALLPALAVLTRSDRVIAGEEQETALTKAFALPSSVFMSEPPEDPEQLLGALLEDKQIAHLLRSGLEPILDRELGPAGSRAAQRVRQVGGADSWLASIVPEPHRFARSQTLRDVEAHSAELLILETDAIDLSALETARAGLVPGGLLVFLLDRAAVAGTAGPTMRELADALRSTFGTAFVFERVWGLHERPGRPTLGGIVAVRPLGANGTTG